MPNISRFHYLRSFSALIFIIGLEGITYIAQGIDSITLMDKRDPKLTIYNTLYIFNTDQLTISLSVREKGLYLKRLSLHEFKLMASKTVLNLKDNS